MANLLLRAVVAVSVSACSNAGVKIAPTGTGGAAYGGGGTQPSGGESSGAGGSDRDAPSAFTIPDVSADQAPSPGPCVNLQCQQVACPNGGSTTVSGTAFAPDGRLPLYNVSVYVPNAPLPALTDGVTCDRCGGGAPVRAVASAVSNEQGKFVLTNVPSGENIPLVLQVGKWRRQVVLHKVAACQDTPITDPNLTRLPRNRQEGNLPRIAVTTGGCDFLGCLLPNVGVDVSELGVAGQNRPITFYKGSAAPDLDGQPPAGMTAATNLWRSEAELSKYDIVLLSCECEEVPANKGPAAYEAMTKYLAKGGRIFGTDYMYLWYRHLTDPKLRAAASLHPRRPEGDDRMGRNPMDINTSFPKGKAFADWVKFINPNGVYGQLAAKQVFDNFASVMTPATQTWTSSLPDTTDGVAGPRIFSINTPVGVPPDQQCGRAVHMDAHIGPNFPAEVPAGFALTFPQLCGGKLTTGEEALAFLFFDLAACVQEDSKPVAPPIIVP